MLMPSHVASFESGGASIQPECPTCGGATVRRTAQSGPRAGAEFWGCANFPHCQGSIAVAVNVRSAAARLREAASSGYRPSPVPRDRGLGRPADVGVTIWDDDPDATTAHLDRPATSTDETADWGLRPRLVQAMQPVAAPAPFADPDRFSDLVTPSEPGADAPFRAPANAQPGTSERFNTAVGGASVAARHAVAAGAPAMTAAGRAAAIGLSVAFGSAATVARRSLAGLAGAASGVLTSSEGTAASGGRDVPGASAQAEFERRAARHRAAVQATLPTVVAVTILGMAAATFAFGSFSSLIGALGAATVGLVGASYIGRLPDDALRWRSHAAAERLTAESLEPLESAGYVVLHDRTVPGIRPNIDHVAIGPAGIFVIETRNLQGALAIVGEKLFVGERARTGLVETTYREAVAVQIALSDALAAARLTVRPIVCVHGTPRLLLEDEMQGLRVVAGTELIGFMRRQPFLLGADEVQALAATTDRLLRPAAA